MTPKKPDRFERVVLAALKKNSSDVDFAVWLNGPDVVTLLRQEHRWMVRMVKKQAGEGCGDVGYMAAINDILDRLTRRAT